MKMTVINTRLLLEWDKAYRAKREAFSKFGSSRTLSFIRLKTLQLDYKRYADTCRRIEKKLGKTEGDMLLEMTAYKEKLGKSS